jgi:hypothetical protein
LAQKKQGRSNDTPAQLDEQQGGAVLLCDECEDQLRRLADQAETFEITSLGFPLEWKNCFARTDEWVRNAAEAVKKNGNGLRNLLRDKGAMEEQAARDLPVFKSQLDRMFRAIQKLYESVGVILPPPGVHRIRGRIVFGTDALDLIFTNRMSAYGLAISQARKTPFQEFYAWRAEERRRPPGSESKLLGTQSRRGSGPSADMKRHRAIARATERFGDKWREGANLKKIAQSLDRRRVPPPKPRMKSEVSARSWEELLKAFRTSFINAISYSRRKAPRR